MPQKAPQGSSTRSRSVGPTNPRAGREGLYQYAAESVGGTPHIGTHIDGLMHATSGTTMFGGCDFTEVARPSGFTSDGIESVPPIVTRAVVLDIGRHSAGDPLPDRYEVRIADIEGTRRVEQNVQFRSGDAVLVRTGKVRQYGVDNDAYQASQPGVGPDAAIWLFEHGMAILGTDTTGTEPLPFAEGSRSHDASGDAGRPRCPSDREPQPGGTRARQNQRSNVRVLAPPNNRCIWFLGAANCRRLGSQWPSPGRG